MASETPRPGSARAAAPALAPTWLRGLSAGLVAGLGMEAFLSVTAPSLIQETVPALTGVSGHLAGSLVHLTASVLLGVVFGVLARAVIGRRAVSAIVLGIAYGLALWVATGVAIPVWLTLVGDGGLPLPWLDPTVLAALLVYGIVLGAGHWLFG